MDSKICPIMQLPLGGQSPCQGEHCAWYIHGRCAVADIAVSLTGIAMDVAALE